MRRCDYFVNGTNFFLPKIHTKLGLAAGLRAYAPIDPLVVEEEALALTEVVKSRRMSMIVSCMIGFTCHVVPGACLFVCLSVCKQLNVNATERIFMKGLCSTVYNGATASLRRVARHKIL